MPETDCTCTLETFCGEGSDAGCPACRAADIYEPCPVFGYGCGFGAKPGTEPCECCTVDQWRMARSA